jgi:predicted acyltransferase
MGNFAGYVDRLFLTGHMWTPANDWDPEGIIGTIPSVSTMLFGVLTGYLLRREGPRERAVGWLFLSGACLLFLGTWLDHLMPINKMIWSVSFTVLMAGISATAFACFYWLIDVQNYRGWAQPAVVFGMNAITLYMFASLLEGAMLSFKIVPVAGEWMSPHRFMDHYVLSQFLSPRNVSLAYSIGMVAVAYVVALAMYRKKWFVRI